VAKDARDFATRLGEPRPIMDGIGGEPRWRARPTATFNRSGYAHDGPLKMGEGVCMSIRPAIANAVLVAVFVAEIFGAAVKLAIG
jgi:hypothetical protein